jgi:hypothetical protein
VTLSGPVGATITTATATGTIINDDTTVALTTLSIAATDAIKNEGNAGTTPFTFTVTRSGDTSGATTVNYAVTGSGANPANADDFTGNVLPGGSVSFAANETSKVISIPVRGDTIVEPNEGFTVTLSGPVGATITTATATGTINNDDTVPPTGPVFALIDLDHSGGSASAQSDGLLVFAALAGVTNETQLSQLLSPSATQTVAEVLASVAVLRTSGPLDVDGNGTVSAQSDGLLIFAILAGVTSPEQLANLTATGATRSIPEIIAYVQSLAAPPVASASSAPVTAAVMAASEMPAVVDPITPSMPGSRDVVLSSSVASLWASYSEQTLQQFHAKEHVPMDALIATQPGRSRDTAHRLGNSATNSFNRQPLSSTSPALHADLDLLDSFFDTIEQDYELLSF